MAPGGAWPWLLSMNWRITLKLRGVATRRGYSYDNDTMTALESADRVVTTAYFTQIYKYGSTVWNDMKCEIDVMCVCVFLGISVPSQTTKRRMSVSWWVPGPRVLKVL